MNRYGYSARLRDRDPFAPLQDWIESGGVVRTCAVCGRMQGQGWAGLEPVYVLTGDPAKALARIIETDFPDPCACGSGRFTYDPMHSYQNWR